jgi:hypothetical protein
MRHITRPTVLACRIGGKGPAYAWSVTWPRPDGSYGLTVLDSWGEALTLANGIAAGPRPVGLGPRAA